MKDPRMPYLSPQEAQELTKALAEGTELPAGHPFWYGDHSALLAELRKDVEYRDCPGGQEVTGERLWLCRWFNMFTPHGGQCDKGSGKDTHDPLESGCGYIVAVLEDTDDVAAGHPC